jgi:hypothetical protein
MGVVVGVVVFGLLIWFTYGRRFRVMLTKRYRWPQAEVPDIAEFTRGPSSTLDKVARLDAQGRPGPEDLSK